MNNLKIFVDSKYLANYEKVLPLSGAHAVAEAMRQINPDTVAAYPITPQTPIVERFSEFVADGKVDTEFIPVESEHSAMSSCLGAAATGCRTFTATSGQGLELHFQNCCGLFFRKAKF